MSNHLLHRKLYLENSLAETLYYDFAHTLPIVDFHNHLSTEDLSLNRKYDDLTEAWIVNDPYKHRVMRMAGVPEEFITGSADNREKYLQWIKIFPKIVGTPLYVWSAIELKKIFDIDDYLSESISKKIWEKCHNLLQSDGYGAADIIERFNCEILCTSDDLLSDLTNHLMISNSESFSAFPSLRGDSILSLGDQVFIHWFKNLEIIFGQMINNLDDFKEAIREQIDKFSFAGCTLADHSMDSSFEFELTSEVTAEKIFKKWLNNYPLDKDEVKRVNSHLLFFLCEEYEQRGWTLQLHIGAQRNTSTRLRKLAGSAGGYAAIGSSCNIKSLVSFFNELEIRDILPKIILYAMNPADNVTFSVITGSFSEDGLSGKIRLGPAWWYNNNQIGINDQLKILSNYGLISNFIGMTSDGHNVFSLSRHDIFRRVLCNRVAKWVKQGFFPNDIEFLKNFLKDICYNNSRQLFEKEFCKGAEVLI